MSGIVIRPPDLSELPALSALQLRSKAHWGYDAAFMAACRAELTLTAADLTETALVVAERNGKLAGVAQVGPDGEDADLMGMFVDPPFIGMGIGKRLFDWSVEAAHRISSTRLLIVSEPRAQAFYEAQGAKLIGTHPSGSIPGRVLPLLAFPLR